MATDSVTESAETNSLNEYISTVSAPTWYNESELSSEDPASGNKFTTTESVNYTLNSDESQSEDIQLAAFEPFIIIEIVMTALELLIAMIAAIKMKRWRRNYRNQMLMQLSIVRFLKRIFAYVHFLKETKRISSTEQLVAFSVSSQIYADYVTAILVFFFIKHMYDTLILVLVKISQINLYRVLFCAWLIPAPISAMCTTFIMIDILDERHVYLLYCCVFKWPLIFLGTSLYLTIVYRVMSDKKRKFARSLTVITFLLCLVINLYLFSIDVIKLWCLHNSFTALVSYVLGFLLNVLTLCLYIVLIVLSFKCKTQSKSLSMIIDE